MRLNSVHVDSVKEAEHYFALPKDLWRALFHMVIDIVKKFMGKRKLLLEKLPKLLIERHQRFRDIHHPPSTEENGGDICRRQNALEYMQYFQHPA